MKQRVESEIVRSSRLCGGGRSMRSTRSMRDDFCTRVPVVLQHGSVVFPARPARAVWFQKFKFSFQSFFDSIKNLKTVLSDVREGTELDGRPTARDTPGPNLNKGVTVVRVCDMVFRHVFIISKKYSLGQHIFLVQQQLLRIWKRETMQDTSRVHVGVFLYCMYTRTSAYVIVCTYTSCHDTHTHTYLPSSHTHTHTHTHARTHAHIYIYIYTHHFIYLCVNVFCTLTMMTVGASDTVFTSFQELLFCQRVLRQNYAFDAIMFNVCATVYVCLCDSDHTHIASYKKNLTEAISVVLITT